MLEKLQSMTGALLAKVMLPVSIGNYTVQEVLMKNHTHVWRNVYNTVSAKYKRYYEYFAKHKCDFSLMLPGQV